MKTPLNWIVGFTPNPNDAPTEFIPATVPGAVQLDWARAHNWRDPAFDPDVNKYAWMEDVYWVYKTTLAFELAQGKNLIFVCKGVDYAYHVCLNGETLYTEVGMYQPIHLDLTNTAKNGDVLEIIVLPVPKSCDTPIDRNQANHSTKPAVAYGWDFHPRLIPLGIWDECFLEQVSPETLIYVDLTYDLAPDFSVAHLQLSAVATNAAGTNLRWSLLNPQNQTVLQHENKINIAHDYINAQAELPEPQLWWCNGQGNPNLYTLHVELVRDGIVIQRIEKRVGFRRVRLVMHPTQWHEREVVNFPKGRHTSPITLELNGRPVFGKGSNWVTPTIFPGTLTHENYREQLQLAKDHHMNLLRCWGGANVQKDIFFELCDELGLMVWQEFPLACNRYEGTPDYLRVLAQEAAVIINRVSQHPCLAMWCGGNELFNNWSRMTDQDAALRLLNKLCYERDPHTPFLMTSPSMGMAHGGYFFRTPDGKEVYQYFAEQHNTAYTEFGVPATPSATMLRQVIPASEIFPPQPATQWQTRHAFKAWEPNSWLDLHIIRDYFGEPRTLEELVAWSQWLQAEGYKAIFEEARRQKPVCSMALNWCFNEPWVAAANNSLIGYPCEPKPALTAVGESCRPLLASARIPKFRWHAGEIFSCDLFLLNDTPESVTGHIQASLHAGSRVFALGDWSVPRTQPNQNAQGPTLRCVLPNAEHGELTLVLRCNDNTEWNSTYRLLLDDA